MYRGIQEKLFILIFFLLSREKEAHTPSTLAQALQAPTLLAASAAHEPPASEAASSSAGGLFSHLSLQHPTDSESSSSDDEQPGMSTAGVESTCAGFQAQHLWGSSDP